MERRVLLAISLSFLVLFLYQAMFMPSAPPSPGVNVSADPVPGASPRPDSASSGNRSAPAPAPAPAEPAAPTPAAVVIGEVAEREITVETAKVRAVFTNRGGRVTHWVLKDFRGDDGQPLDLVPKQAAVLPFSLRVDDPATMAWLNDTVYRARDVEGATFDATSQPQTLTFEAETADGLRARKVFAFEPQSYIVTVSAAVSRDGQPLNPAIESGPGLGDDVAQAPPGSFFSPNFLYKAQAILHMDGDVERVPAASVGTGIAREGAFRWAGVDDHYFINAVLQPPPPSRIAFQQTQLATGGPTPATGNYVSYAIQFPAPPEHVRFYLGPKQLDVMRAIDPEFTRAIYFGMFAWLAAPLLDGLKWVHGYVGDWGWSIIVLTILINLAMFPLRHKSVVSMRKMQELQPQMKAIQDRYAKYKITDPERQKMNTEVMELYRTKGVNPASGCVPMLLTMPFLFAFYAMLGQAIEIRGEGFLGWIPDLSRADPFYITPALMGLSMFWQMRIQPSTADPTQQKIMMFMPIMITVTMLFAPAGLVIYWLVSNIWTIGQQYFTNYLIGPPKVHNVRPPAVSKPRDVRNSKSE
jgi:YidC/Oxa1 family membrane protein insertase